MNQAKQAMDELPPKLVGVATGGHVAARAGAKFCRWGGVNAGATQRLDHEIEDQLQWRLKAAAALFALSYSVVIARFFLVMPSAAILPGVALAIVVGSGIILWSRPGLSLGALRGIEYAMFGMLLVDLVVTSIVMLSNSFEAGDLGAYRDLINRLPGFAAVAMVAYGMLVPNTGWRALGYVTAVSLGTLAVPVVLRVKYGVERFDMVGSPLEQGTFFVTMMLIAGMLAVFGSRMLSKSRRQVAEMGEAGMYELTEKCGSGGMGEVWRAEHRMLRRSVAIKMIRGDVLGAAGGDTAVERFRREAQATASLESPHTVELYDFGVTRDGTFYYVMEFLSGFDLSDLIKEYGPVSPARAIHLLRQAAASLQEAHERGLVHRDIKPGNIHVGRRAGSHDWVRVLDFGLVKSFAPDDDAAQLTQEGLTTGTPAYFPPEMVGGTGAADERSDIYALSAVAYWLVTGQQLFPNRTPLEMLVAHVKEEPVPPSRLTEAEMPAGLDRLILKGLAKNPDDRPQSMREIIEALDAIELPQTWNQTQASEWWRLHRPEEPAGRVA